MEIIPHYTAPYILMKVQGAAEAGPSGGRRLKFGSSARGEPEPHQLLPQLEENCVFVLTENQPKRG